MRGHMDVSSTEVMQMFSTSFMPATSMIYILFLHTERNEMRRFILSTVLYDVSEKPSTFIIFISTTAVTSHLAFSWTDLS